MTFLIGKLFILVNFNSPFMNLNGPNTVSRSVGFNNNKNWKKVNFRKLLELPYLIINIRPMFEHGAYQFCLRIGRGPNYIILLKM